VADMTKVYLIRFGTPAAPPLRFIQAMPGAML